MSHNQSWRTAFIPALPKLLEQYETAELRLFDDPVIKCFHGTFRVFMMQFKVIRTVEKLMANLFLTGGFGLVLCRTKYIDDLLQQALASGVGQVVILGAGLDTRPYRIAALTHHKVFEVDLPIMQDIKKQKVERALGQLPAHVTYVPIDFNQQTLDEAFAATHLNMNEPVFFIWEGVTQYLSEEGVENTLAFIAKMPVGSAVAFSYILSEVIDKKSTVDGVNDMLAYFVAKDQAWMFGLTPATIAAFLKPFNLSPVQDVGASYYQEQYLRPLGRKLSVAPIERVIYAAIT